MAKARISDLKDREFYQVPKWLVDVEGLQPADIMVYMLAWNNWKLSEKNGYINENGEVYFFLTHESLKETFNFGKNQIIASLKRLIACGALIAEKEKGLATKYYIEIDTREIDFDITSLEKSSTQNKTTLVTKKRLPQSEKSDHHQSEKSDINKTELNKTKVNKTNTIISELEKEPISVELKEKIIEFIEYRKEIGHTIKTYKAIKGILNKLKNKEFVNEQHLIDSIDESIANQYQGVFPKKNYRVQIEQQEESYNTRRLRELMREEEKKNARNNI